MSFQFGSNASGLKSNQSAFGTSGFGASSQPSFGAFGANTSAPSFGFGSSAAKPATTASPFGFGGQTAAPNVSVGFGQTAPAPSFGFGKPTTGTAATAAPAGNSLFNFGTTAATTTASAAPAFGQFSFKPAGTPATTAPAPLFGGTATSNAFSGFGAAAPSWQTQPKTGPVAGTSLFGSSFGSFTNTQQPQQQQQQQSSSLFSSFQANKAPAATNLFSGLGTNSGSTVPQFTGFNTLGASKPFSQQPPLTAQQSTAELVQAKLETEYRSVYNCHLYGDERDVIIAKFNLLQAYCGFGHGYYAHSKPPIQYTPDNLFCRFKSYAYCLIPEGDNNDGLVELFFNRKEDDMVQQRNQIFATLNVLFGDKPTISVTLKSKRKLSETKCILTICVQERLATGAVKKVTATELSAFLNQPNVKQQLLNLGVEFILPKVKISEETINSYLANVPNGLTASMWSMAIENNSHPTKCAPIPIIGYEDLKFRKRQQEYEMEQQKMRMNELVDDLNTFKSKQIGLESKLADLRRKHSGLQHKTLKVICKFDMIRKSGRSLQPAEEDLKSHLEALTNELNGHNQFRNRFNALLAQAKTIGSAGTRTGSSSKDGAAKTQRAAAPKKDAAASACKMNENVQDEIMTFLKNQKEGLTRLVEIVRNDANDLKIMQKSLLESYQTRQFAPDSHRTL